MFSLELKSRLLMIELRRIPPDEFEFPSMMFFMAGGALKIARRVMISGLRLNPRPNLYVTIQALIAECLLAKVVALRAILYSVEFRVCVREFTGRDELRENFFTKKKQRCEKKKCSEENRSHENVWTE